MMKIYKYVNATVSVVKSDNNHSTNLQKSTENFLRKVLKERIDNGYGNTCGDFTKE